MWSVVVVGVQGGLVRGHASCWELPKPMLPFASAPPAAVPAPPPETAALAFQ